MLLPEHIFYKIMTQVNTKSKRILVIDDDASVLHALGLVLEAEGYDVTTAEGYDGRLKKVATADLPDLVVLDILLSNENGCAIARELKAADKTAAVPIVMISAHPDGQRMAKTAGADAYLAKPFDVDELLGTIDRLSSD